MAEVFTPDVYREVLESLTTGIYLVDRERRILLWNDGAERITGYLRHEVIGRRCADNILMHCDETSRVLCGCACPLQDVMRDGDPQQVDVFLRHKDGQRVPVRVRAIAIRDSAGNVIGAAESFDERVLLPEPGIHPNSNAVQDCKDELTGILDHHSIRSHLCASLLDFAEYRTPFSILDISIDKLQELQDFHGRRALEAVVAVIARTLARNLRPVDRVGRLPENHFLIILADCPEADVHRIAEMLQRISAWAGIPWWGDRLSVTISIGATAVRNDDTAETLLGRAALALEQSLAGGESHINIL